MHRGAGAARRPGRQLQPWAGRRGGPTRLPARALQAAGFLLQVSPRAPAWGGPEALGPLTFTLSYSPYLKSTTSWARETFQTHLFQEAFLDSSVLLPLSAYVLL